MIAMNALKYLFPISLVLLLSCFGVKQIHHYKQIKKQIHSVSNVIVVYLWQIKDDKNKKYSEWDRIHSSYCDSIVSRKIQNYVKKYSKKKFVIKTVPMQSDSILNTAIVNLFGKLESSKKIDTVQVDSSLINAFSSIDNQYILLIYQEGYCFSRRYLDNVEAKEAGLLLLSAAGMGAFVAGGTGFVVAGNFNKGLSNIGMAFIDKSLFKVLYYSSRRAYDDPLGDSLIINQLESMFIRF